MPVKRLLLFLLGTLSLLLGLIGMLFPVLPTTPFLLMSAACYLKSSRKMYAWLMKNRFTGPLIYEYSVTRAVPLATKRSAIAIVWLGIGLSMALVHSLPVRVLLPVIALGVTWHISSLKTLRPEDIPAARQQYRQFAAEL